MTYYQLPNGYTRDISKLWSNRIGEVENFDELLDISAKLNSALESLPVNVIGDLQLQFKRKARQIKARINGNIEFAEIM